MTFSSDDVLRPQQMTGSAVVLKGALSVVEALKVAAGAHRSARLLLFGSVSGARNASSDALVTCTFRNSNSAFCASPCTTPRLVSGCS